MNNLYLILIALLSIHLILLYIIHGDVKYEQSVFALKIKQNEKNNLISLFLDLLDVKKGPETHSASNSMLVFQDLHRIYF